MKASIEQTKKGRGEEGGFVFISEVCLVEEEEAADCLYRQCVVQSLERVE